MLGFSQGLSMSNFRDPYLSIPEIPRMPTFREEYAKAVNAGVRSQFEILVQTIRSFEAKLDPEHEVGAYLVSGAGGHTFHILSLKRQEGLIIFEGIMDGSPISLVQHHTQLNVILKALPKIHEQPVRLGFILPKT